MSEKTVGIIGDGQLGRMMVQSVEGEGYTFNVLGTKGPESPAAQAGAHQFYGASLYDRDAIMRLANDSDVITWEVEHIGVEPLVELEDQGYPVYPSPRSLGIIQDKLAQKTYFGRFGLPVAPFVGLDTADNYGDALQTFGDVIVKARTGGYDGRGNLVVSPGMTWNDVTTAFTDGNTGKRPELYAEQTLDYKKELAVILARDVCGKTAVYPVVETRQVAGQCDTVLAPAEISPDMELAAQAFGRSGLSTFDGPGVFAFEMFLTRGERIFINEVAPRVHNSGHFSILASETSQFRQHVLAITGRALGSTAMKQETPAAAMVNILGRRGGAFDETKLKRFKSVAGLEVNWYGKTPRPHRKLGHVTASGATVKEAQDRARWIRETIEV